MAASAQGRGVVSKRIEALSPVDDYEEIIKLLSYTLFPWDIERALEFALFRTYAVPSISRLLAATGEFTNRPRKRYDDTELILGEISEHGIESERGQRSLARMNDMHGRFRISNDDFLYVISTFIFEPIRWVERFGVRPFTAKEKEAWFNYYVALGGHMNIQDLPEDMDKFEQFNLEYENQHYSYAESNHIVGEATRDMFLGVYLPKPLVGVGEPVVYAMMESSLLAAFGFPEPSLLTRRAVAALMSIRKSLLGLLPENTKPKYITARKRPTYPGGYIIESLGTFSGKNRESQGIQTTQTDS